MTSESLHQSRFQVFVSSAEVRLPGSCHARDARLAPAGWGGAAVARLLEAHRALLAPENCLLARQGMPCVGGDHTDFITSLGSAQKGLRGHPLRSGAGLWCGASPWHLLKLRSSQEHFCPSQPPWPLRETPSRWHHSWALDPCLGPCGALDGSALS